MYYQFNITIIRNFFPLVSLFAKIKCHVPFFISSFYRFGAGKDFTFQIKES